MVNETSKIEVCQLNDEELCNIVKLVMSVVDSFDNFKEVEDPLPKFSCDTMSLDIGERRVEIIKQIQQSDLYTLYGGLEGRKYVTVKCLEKTVLVFYQSLWDLYVSNEIHKRIQNFSANDFLLNQDKSILENFLAHTLVCIFQDIIYVESQSSCVGGNRTVMDTVDLFKKNNSIMDESLALLYAYEILNIVHTLHKIGIIHCDINPTILQQQNFATDSRPVDSRLITLTDFRGSIDLTVLQDHERTMFSRSSVKTTYPCPEMQQGEPWKYNVDYYAAASTIHMIVFQREMDGDHDLLQTLAGLRSIIPQNWNTRLWLDVFSTLLVRSSLQPVNLVNLISQLGAQLIDPKVTESLKKAQERIFEMKVMGDDYDDDDDDDDEEEDVNDKC